MLAIPTRGEINSNTVRRILELQEKFPGVIYHIEAASASSSSTRNQIVRRFRQDTQCEVLIQIDDDVGPRMTVLDLADSPYDIVAGPYFLVREEMNIPFPSAFRWTGTGYVPIDNVFSQTGIVPCDAVSTGCMAVKRRVFEHPDLTTPFDMKYDEWGVVKWSDDIHFCHRAKQAGFTIAADFTQSADHMPRSLSLNRLQQGYMHAFSMAQKKGTPLVTLGR